MKKRIKEICDFVSRGSAPAYVDESGNKVMNQATFSKGWIDESNIRYSSKADNAANIHRGDLLMASTGGGVLGKIVYFDKLDENFYADSHVTIMRNSKNKNSMKFLYYYFYTRYDEINATMAKGSTNQTELQRNSLLAYEIDIPDFGTQLRIVDYLDSKTAAIDSQISVLEKKREAYERLKQSVINRAVTRGLDANVTLKASGVDWIGMVPEHWETLRVKDVATLRNERTDETVLPYIALENISSWDAKFHSTSCSTEGTNGICYEGDVLFSKLRPYLAKGYLVQKRSICSTEFFVLIPKKNIRSRYLLYYILSPHVINFIKNQVAGVKMPRTNWNEFGILPIPVPAIEEQTEIERFLDYKSAEIDRAIENTTKQIDAYKRLKRSLINEVVTGQRAV